jgi:hypothetical protein
MLDLDVDEPAAGDKRQPLRGSVDRRHPQLASVTMRCVLRLGRRHADDLPSIKTPVLPALAVEHEPGGTPNWRRRSFQRDSLVGATATGHRKQQQRDKHAWQCSDIQRNQESTASIAGAALQSRVRQGHVDTSALPSGWSASVPSPGPSLSPESAARGPGICAGPTPGPGSRPGLAIMVGGSPHASCLPCRPSRADTGGPAGDPPEPAA